MVQRLINARYDFFAKIRIGDKEIRCSMKNLILHPTETSQWHAIVNEAQADCQLILNENTESYLVFLLMRFTHQTQWMHSVVAFDFLQALKSQRHGKISLLQEVGDKSLLLSGLFPETAARRVNLSYFTDMGQMAYLSIGDLHEEPTMSGLYYELSEQFSTMQKILQTMSCGSGIAK